MTKIKFQPLILIFLFLFFSCERDDNTPINGNTSSQIVGVWDQTFHTIINTEGYYTNYPSGQVIITEDTSSMVIGNTFISRVWEFKSSGDWSDVTNSVLSNESYTGTWSKNGNDLTISYSDPNDPSDYGIQLLTINTLTNNSFIVTFEESDTTYNANTGYVDFYDDINIMEFEK